MAFLNLQEVCLPHTVLKLWQVCTLKARKNSPKVPSVTSQLFAAMEKWVQALLHNKKIVPTRLGS
jgi:hypothetical protein